MTSFHGEVAITSNDSEHPVSETACSTAGNLLASCSTDVIAAITVMPPEETLDSRRLPLATENGQNGNDHNHNCENCASSASDEGSLTVHPVNPHDEKMLSILRRNTACPTECLADANFSVDGEAHSCAPIVAVGGTREEELRRGLGDGISQNFFCSMLKGSYSSTPFRIRCYLHRFQRYLRSNSKVVVKRTKFWTFFALPNFKGGDAPKSCTCVNTPT